jgi:hypothetical protein
MSNNAMYILAERVADGTFKPQEVAQTQEDLYSSLEYGDVREHEYQLWEYPSGRMMWIEPDRKVDERHYYATPYGKDREIWLPILKDIGINEAGVSEAYEQLTSK